MAPLAYTTQQVADALQVSDRTVRRMVRKGLLQPVPYLDQRQIRIAAAELHRFLNERKAS